MIVRIAVFIWVLISAPAFALAEPELQNDSTLSSVLEQDIMGSATVEYTIGTEGRATACKIVETSGNEKIDRQTCALILKRFKFDPAIENGEAVEVTRTQKLVWALPSHDEEKAAE